MHWVQFIETVAAFAATAGAFSAFYFPYKGRRDARLALLVTQRDAALKQAITSGIIEQTEQIKQDTISRIDESDMRVTHELGEIKASVETLRARSEEDRLAMAKQFGGNGNGIRQAIDKHGTDLANLAGKFEQHLTEVSK